MSGESGESFRVDLRGIVDILSHHLYSSPRVYLRELIQNARDAVVARRLLDPNSPDGIVIEVVEDAQVVVVRDNGIGLTEDEMRTVLATIGASSKRQDFAQARRQYLGQFGIGMLSCFLVADRIEVRSRSARTTDAPTLSWVGNANGTFAISPAAIPLEEAGTEVRVQARADDREWVDPRRVRLLAERFAELLDLPVTLSFGAVAPGHSGARSAELISTKTPPWSGTESQAVQWCRRELGFVPLATLPIELPAAGVVGVAFIADSPGRVGNRRGDTVYSHGMFVAENNVQLVPRWAYFVRLVIEAGDLALTASRESLQDSSTIDEVMTQIGVQIRDGIERFAIRDPRGFARFLDVHAKGLLAMAVSDADMLDLVIRNVFWETNEGRMTLTQVLRVRDSVQYTTSMTDFTAFAPLLRARGILLINGSYVYGIEILRLVEERRGRIGSLRAFDSAKFLESLPGPADEDMIARGLDLHARPVLDRLGVDLDLRDFAPESVPVLFMSASGRLDVSGEDSGPDDPWLEFLSEPEKQSVRPRLVMNVSSVAVRSIANLADARVREEAISGLYVIGLLTAGEKLDERHSALLNGSLQTLIAAAGSQGPSGSC